MMPIPHWRSLSDTARTCGLVFMAEPSCAVIVGATSTRSVFYLESVLSSRSPISTILWTLLNGLDTCRLEQNATRKPGSLARKETLVQSPTLAVLLAFSQVTCGMVLFMCWAMPHRARFR